MIEEHLRVAATLDYLMSSLERRVSQRRPRGVRKPHFYRRPIAPDYLGEGRRQLATIYDTTRSNHNVPIVEIWAVEKDRCCEVTARCYEPRHAEWFGWFLAATPGDSLQQEDGSAPLPETSANWLGKLLTLLGIIPESEEVSNAEAPENAISTPARSVTSQPALHPETPRVLPNGPAQVETDLRPAMPPIENTQSLPPSDPPPKRLAPGRKPLTDEEIAELRKQFQQRPFGMSVAEFCDTIAHMSETTFRKYVPESERWGTSVANAGNHADACANSEVNSDANANGDPDP